MPSSRSTARFAAALSATIAISALTVATVLAHPESEGEHGGCVVTAEPGTIPVGGQFTVAGNFGGASIFVLPGPNATVPEDATPDATTPVGASSFSVTFTATGSAGDLTIVAFIEGSECGDTDHITVTGTLPNTAMDGPADPTVAIAALLLFGAVLALGWRSDRTGRRA